MTFFPLLPARVAAAFALAHVLTAAAQGTDADVLAAKAAFDRGDRARLDAIAPRAQGHVLEPYVAYWRLKLGIDTAEPEVVRAFVALAQTIDFETCACNAENLP